MATRPAVALADAGPRVRHNPGAAAVSFLARYAGRTHELYAYQLRRWFGWCEANGLDPLLGIQRAHVELYAGSS